MFNKKSNTAFNNKVFSSSTMGDMKPSMEFLYELAKKKDIKSPSAVARALKSSQQTLKNWEARGISKEGAMKAQKMFGCDSNDLLAMDLGQVKQPHTYPTVKDTPAAPPFVQDLKARAQTTKWPFKDVTVSQWETITPDDKGDIERFILRCVKAVDPPAKQRRPAPHAAAG